MTQEEEQENMQENERGNFEEDHENDIPNLDIEENFVREDIKKLKVVEKTLEVRSNKPNVMTATNEFLAIPAKQSFEELLLQKS